MKVVCQTYKEKHEKKQPFEKKVHLSSLHEWWVALLETEVKQSSLHQTRSSKYDLQNYVIILQDAQKRLRNSNHV